MLEKKYLEMTAEIVRETNRPIYERPNKADSKVTEIQMIFENEQEMPLLW